MNQHEETFFNPNDYPPVYNPSSNYEPQVDLSVDITNPVNEIPKETNVVSDGNVENKKQIINANPIRSPYVTEDINKKEYFDITQVLPVNGNVINEIGDFAESIQAKIKQYKPNTPEFNKYKAVLDELVSLEGNIFYSATNYANFFEKHKDLYQRILTDNGTKLGIQNLLQNPNDTGIELVGDAAKRHGLQTTGVSLASKVECFASGVKLMFDPFTTTEISTLSILLTMSETSVGRSLGGSAFTGDDVFLISVIIDVLLSKVSGTNVKEFNNRTFDKELIKQTLLVTDLWAILTAGAAAIYPRGYPVLHPCTAPGCDYVLEAPKNEYGEYLPDALLKFSELIYTRYELLTSEDLDYWSKPVVTKDEVLQYQSRRLDVFKTEFNNKQKFYERNEGQFNSEHNVGLKIPTISEYITEAGKWCNAIDSYISKVVDQNRPAKMGNAAFEKYKEEQTQRYLSDIILGKYTPYISYIEIIDRNNPDNTKIIKDRDSIFIELTEVYSIDVESLKNITTIIKNFKETYTMSFSGVPNFPCPKCETSQSDPDDKNNKLIPINIVNFIYAIMVWRSQR